MTKTSATSPLAADNAEMNRRLSRCARLPDAPRRYLREKML
jgi:hypothetical protein